MREHVWVFSGTKHSIWGINVSHHVSDTGAVHQLTEPPGSKMISAQRSRSK